MRIAPDWKITQAAFTLIELMVALAVLAILIVLLTQIFSLVANTWASGRSQANNFSQARVALDVMARDLEGAALRPDLPAFFSGSAPKFVFYSQQQGLVSSNAGGNRPLSRVDYAITNTTNGSLLRRSSRGFNFSDDIGYASTNWSVSTNGNVFPADIGPGILVMRYQFIGLGGTNLPPASVNASWTNAATLPGVGALRAVTISVAVMDAGSMKILQDSGKLSQLQGNFSTNNPGAIRSYASDWQLQVDDASGPLAAGGIPRRVLRGVKVFERTVPLPVSPEP